MSARYDAIRELCELAITRTTDASLILLLQAILRLAQEQQQRIEALQQALAAEEQGLPFDSDEPER